MQNGSIYFLIQWHLNPFCFHPSLLLVIILVMWWNVSYNHYFSHLFSDNKLSKYITRSTLIMYIHCGLCHACQGVTEVKKWPWYWSIYATTQLYVCISGFNNIKQNFFSDTFGPNIYNEENKHIDNVSNITST